MTKNAKTQAPHERNSLNSLVEKTNPSLPFLVKVHEVWLLLLLLFFDLPCWKRNAQTWLISEPGRLLPFHR